MEPDDKKWKEVTYALIEHSKKYFGYMDLTGKFPFFSTRGNQCILVAYGYNSNDILLRALKNRNTETITNTWEDLHKEFDAAGAAPKTYVLNNEA